MNEVLASTFLISLSIVIYLNSSFNQFVFDDLSAVVKNKDVSPELSLPISSLLYNDFWGTPMIKEHSHKSYRPFTVLTFKLNALVFGLEPHSFHIINILLNAIVTFLVFKLNLKFTKKAFEEKLKKPENTFEKEYFISFVAALLFAVHPIHTEAVSGVVGRAELLSAIFFILAILSYSSNTYKSLIVSFIFCIFAVASKEQGITVLGVCMFYDIFIANKLTLDDFCLVLTTIFIAPKQVLHKKLLLRCLLLFLFALFLLFCRLRIMDGTLPHFTAFDNPAAVQDFPVKPLTYNYILSLNAWLLLNPSNLLCDYTMGTIPLVQEFSDPRNIATLVFWSGFIIIGFYSAFQYGSFPRLVGVAFSILVFSFLPSSNLFFPVGFVVAERVLYIPSIGFTLLIAIGMFHIKNKIKNDLVIWGLLGILVSFYSMKVIARNYDWKSEGELFKSALKVTTTNAKVWNNIGHSYENKDKFKTALHYFEKATSVQPDDIGAYMNVARMLERMSKLQEAENTLWKARELFPKPITGKPYQTRIAPQHLKVYIRLCNLIRKDDSRLKEADELYQEVLRMRPSFVDAYINRGEILTQMNRPVEGIAQYKKALIHAENKSDIYFNIGVVYGNMGNVSGALEGYTYAIYHDPKHIKALYNSATILQETKSHDLLVRAESRVKRILAIESDHILSKTLLGAIYMDMGENAKAIKWWKEVLNVNPTERGTLFNLALLYSSMEGKINDAVEVVKKLIFEYPNHVKGLSLHGDLMTKQNNNDEAIKSFLKIIEVDPTNVHGRHSLCVVYVNQNDLHKGEQCLIETLNLAPDQKYIAENLAIVRQQISIIEANSQKLKEKETHFVVEENIEEIIVEPTVKSKEIPKEEEEIILVAESKHKSFTTQAKKITRSLSSNKEETIEEKLTNAIRAVEQLKDLDKKITTMTREKCTNVNKVKQKALTFLDKLESIL